MEVKEVKLQFKDQEFQQSAVDSIAGKEGIFSGQSLVDSIYTLSQGFSDVDVQQITLSNDQILTNLRNVQKKNGIKQSKKLDLYEVCYEYKDDDGFDQKNEFLNLTVEMETGTGKTYVYINTILELNKNFGWTKFIIVVPSSTAIREGVINSLIATKERFQSKYDNVPYDFFAYSGEKSTRIRSFANDRSLQIMVVTKGSFDNESNIMNKGKAKEDFRTPIEFIRDIRPIVIIDEPQSVDSQIVGKKAIASLNPCVVIRYSATHKSVYNLAYKLGPVEAHKNNLVKEILVSSIRSHKNFNMPYIKVLDVTYNKTYKAKLEIDFKNKKGIVERKIINVNKNSQLFNLSGERDFYSNFKISNIDARPGFESVHFDNGIIISLNNSIGDVDEASMKKAQIMRTIELHFENEKKLLSKGIKVLSLFFIDHVAKYRGNDGKKGDYYTWFEECYNELRFKYPDLNMTDAEFAHKAYFSQDSKKNGIYKDTRGETKEDESTYNLIMKDKGQLLSLKNPVRFIFSHSALKEGWDNPNVFQICTLLEPKTEFTRRQKIGRGLRLCFNQEGHRIEDKDINKLYVISDESFTEFAKNLQKNYEDDLGITLSECTRNIFSEIKIKKEVVKTTLDDLDIKKTIEINVNTGAIDQSGNIIDPEKITIHHEIINNREQIIEKLKSNNKLNETTLKNLTVEIINIEEENIPSNIIDEVIDELQNKGYIDKHNKPTELMKESLKKGLESLPIVESAEFARQAIFNCLKDNYSTPDVNDVDNMDLAIAKRDVISSDNFKKLWDKIKTKTYYRINLKDDILKAEILTEIKNAWSYIDKIKIFYQDANVKLESTGIHTSASTQNSLNNVVTKHRIPNLLSTISEQCNISRKLVYDIFISSNKADQFLNNPQLFIEQFVYIINKIKSRLEVLNIEYIPLDSSFDFEEVFNNFENFTVNKNLNAVEVEHSIYNYIKYDSDKVELNFAKQIDIDKNVELFIKLPTKKYTIATPFGSYTPDWAIIKRNIHGKQQTIYFVVETKGTSNDIQYREIEKSKILCAKAHYKSLGFEIVVNEPLIYKDSKYVVKQNYTDFALEN